MEKINDIKSIVDEFFSYLGFNVEANVSYEEGSYNVLLKSINDPAIFIGYHGDTLNSLQTIISLLLYKKFGETVPLVLDIDGYRKERIEKLKSLAVRFCDKARFLTTPQTLPPMNAFERRIVHMAVSEIPDMKSESVGEGRDRRVVISPGSIASLDLNDEKKDSVPANDSKNDNEV